MSVEHNYIHALCRVYVGVCRQLGDLERARLFCYGLLKEGARGWGRAPPKRALALYLLTCASGFPAELLCVFRASLWFSGRICVTDACLGQHVHPCCVWEGLSPLRPGVPPCAAALDSDVVGTGGRNRCDAANCAVSLAGRSGNCGEFIGSQDVSGRHGKECCPSNLSFQRCVFSLLMGADVPHS